MHLIKGIDSDRWTHARTEADGSFTFDGVAVGEYFLVLNPDNEAPGEDDPPYARAFYPDATDGSGAKKIVVTEGAVLENLTLRVGPPLRARTVWGRVVWQDGRAAANAHLLYGGDRYVRLIQVDKKGRFSFKVYGDFKYAVEAKMSGEPSGESARIALPDKSTDLTLVVKSN